MRIAMLTFAVPWDARPTNGLYNIAQARALSELGAHTEIFSLAPNLPRSLARLGGALRRQIMRPQRYLFEDVRVHTVRARVAYPKLIRDHVVPRFPGLVSSTFRRLTKDAMGQALRAFEPDALLVHGMQPWGDFATNYAQRYKTKLVFLEHSQGDVMRSERGTPLSRFISRIGSQADATLAVNEQLVDHLSSLGVPRTSPLLNGVNTLEQPATPEQTTARPFRILCAGGYYPRKGHIQLIEGFARASLANTELILVGEPPAHIQREIKSRGLGEQVTVLPLLPNEQLIAEMARADLFALPSWSESFGLVFMESLGAGTPVLMTHDSGAAIHLTHGKHGWIVPPRDASAIAVALQDAHRTPAEKRRAMGQAGRNLIRSRFSWTQNAETVLRCMSGTHFKERVFS